MDEEKQELLTINYDSNIPTVSARELYEGLGIKSNFTTWFDRMREYGFELEKDFFPKMEESTGGRPAMDYQISVDMAKQICMIQRSEKGRQYRQYFLDLEKAWNTPEQVFARALKMADQTIKKLETENAVLIKENKEMIPKAEFHDRVASSEDAITFEQMAKILKSHGIKNIGRNRLFADLRDSKVLKSDNVPYQKFMESGYFKVRERAYICEGEPHVGMQTLITAKGQKKIVDTYHNGTKWI